MFGTWESGRVCDPGDASVAERDVAQFIAELNQAFPSLDLRLDEVLDKITATAQVATGEDATSRAAARNVGVAWPGGAGARPGPFRLARSA